MPDNSLPKPVPPAEPKQDQQQQGQKQQGQKQQMPPSARVGQQPAQPSKPPQPSRLSQPQSTSTKPELKKKPELETKPGLKKKPGLKTKPDLAESPQLNKNNKNNNKNKNKNKNKTKKPENQTEFAKVKNSPFKYIPYLIGVLVLVGVGFFIWRRFFGNNTQSVSKAPPVEQAPARKQVPAKQVTLSYWGLWEPSHVLSDVLRQFEEQNPEIKVNYSKQSHRDYRERLQTALVSGNGPDVFRYHASWVPMLREELAMMPQAVMTVSEYEQTFYPVASEMLNLNGQIVGLPLMYEGLALYYNTEMLDAADAEPPKTWAELKTLANQLTVKRDGMVQRGGLAIGNASNVEHFADILALLMLQNGADLSEPTSQEAQDALVFYTNFVEEDEVWSEQLPNATVAFARGDVAMIFAPSWRAHEIIEMNPDLDFAVTTVPRLGDQRLSWASFWAEGVSSKSDAQEEGWQLLQFLSSQEVQRQLYSDQSQTRSFGEIYSRQDLADELADNELVAPYLEDAPYAQGWYLSSYTHDNGLNDLLIKHYEDAINEVLSGTSAEEALQTVAAGTRQVLRQYGVGSLE